MVHIGTAVLLEPAHDVTPFSGRAISNTYSILVVRDDDLNSDFLDAICEFLDIGVEHANSADDLGPILRGLRPMAVVTDLVGEVQDGFHVMKVAAGYDKALPILLMTNNELTLLGAVDAVREIWGLSRVTTLTNDCGIGTLVDFLCHAARDAGRSRLMRI